MARLRSQYPEQRAKIEQDLTPELNMRQPNSRFRRVEPRPYCTARLRPFATDCTGSKAPFQRSGLIGAGRPRAGAQSAGARFHKAVVRIMFDGPIGK